MGFRFRKSFKVLPGVRINVGKSGLSTSIGGKGMTVNMKPGRKTRYTVGIPGTGVSYSTSLDEQERRQFQPPRASGSSRAPILGLVLFAIVLWVIFR